MSKLVGEIIQHAWDSDPTCIQNTVTDTKSGTCFPGPVIARALALLCGGIVCAIGLLRLGWLVEFIPLVAISAFMTGSAINIAVGQVPNLLGISVNADYNTRAQTYKVFYKTLRNLPLTRIDAALGLTALFALYLWRFLTNYMARKQPHRRRMWYIIGTLRTAIVLLFYVMVSALCLLNYPRTSDGADEIEAEHWAVLGPVPRGFTHAGVERINSNVISEFSSYLPAAVIVLLIEHIAIAKSFGRVNNYTINPSQELVAIGVTNLLSPFLGGYPATGSFSRTAIKSKAGVRTPLAGVITAIVVLLAIYALPPAFFYIPSAALSAVIIHAVGDLITPPNVVYQFWRVSPLEVPIFFAGVLVIIFSTIEYGVYVVITTSLALYLWRAFKAKGHFMGPVKVHSVIGDHYVEGKDAHLVNPKEGGDGDTAARTIFLPIEPTDGSNPQIHPEHPYPGIFIFRFSEGFNYPNASYYTDQLVTEIFRKTQKTNPHSYARPGDRPWNDPGPRKGQEVNVADTRPTLKAIILDMSAVNNVDTTSVQNLIDVRNQLDRYADPDRVQWHFAFVKSRWTKRALSAGGFGYATPAGDPHFHRWKPIFSIGEIRGAAEAQEVDANLRRDTLRVAEEGKTGAHHEADSIQGSEESNGHGIAKELRDSQAYKSHDVKTAVITGLNRPFFHTDLTSALQSAIRNTESLRVAEAGSVRRKSSGVVEDNPVSILPPEKVAELPMKEGKAF